MIEYAYAPLPANADETRPQTLSVNRWPSGLTRVTVWGPGGEEVVAEIELPALETKPAPDGD